MPRGNGICLEGSGFNYKEDFMAKGDGTGGGDEKYGLVFTVTLIICTFLLIGMVVVIVNRCNKTYESPEDIQWNHGTCAACETPWHYIDSVGAVNYTHYIYECECGEHRMESCTLR